MTNKFDWGLSSQRQQEDPAVKTARVLDEMQVRRQYQKDTDIANQVINKFFSDNPEAQKDADLVFAELARIPRDPVNDYRREKALNQAWENVQQGRSNLLGMGFEED